MTKPTGLYTFVLMGMLTASAAAAEYPTKPVTVIVPANAGGSTDAGTRLLAEAIEEPLGQPWVIVNRPGAGTLVGMQVLADAPADGYTLGYTHQPFLATNIYTKDAAFTVDDFLPVALLVDDPNTIAVSVDSPWQTFDDLVAAMKEKPGEISWGDTGYLSDDHLVTAAVARDFGVEPNTVHFDGSAPLTAAILGGHVNVYVGNLGDTKIPVEEGNLRLLAVANDERLADFPDTPTLRELGADIVASSARGVSFPAGTPVEYADIMAEAIAKASEDPEYVKRMEDQGLTVRVLLREEYGDFLRSRMDFVRGLLDELDES